MSIKIRIQLFVFIIHLKGHKDIRIIHQNNYEYFLLYLRELCDCVLFFKIIFFLINHLPNFIILLFSILMRLRILYSLNGIQADDLSFLYSHKSKNLYAFEPRSVIEKIVQLKIMVNGVIRVLLLSLKRKMSRDRLFTRAGFLLKCVH